MYSIGPVRPAGKSEWGLLCALAVWALLAPAIALVAPGASPSPLTGGGWFTGAEGIQVGDQLQYMAWIRDAGSNLVFSNRFDTIADPHLFLHPMWVLSGAAWQAGLDLQLAFAAWKPVGLVVLLGGYAAYVRRLVVADAGARAAALALALFFFAPVAWLSDWASLGDADLRFGSLVIALELFPAGLLWGIIPTAIALGLMPLFLLGAERLVDGERGAGGRSRRRYVAGTAVAGALASWLHPWQGLILLGILAGLVAWGRFGRRYLVLAVPGLATVAPLVYYWALTHTDSAWRTVSGPNGMPHVGWWLVLGLGTALACALPGLARPPREDLQERALLLWPVVSLAVYFGLQSSYFYHALAGLTLPLAVLAVRGVRRLRLPAPVAAAALALATLPGMAFAVAVLVRDGDLRVLRPGEAAALDYLEDAGRPGAVMAPVRLGRAVPAFTGRQTWVGHPTWTPANPLRESQAEALFSGRLDPVAARALVDAAGVAFLVSDCEHRHSLAPALGARLASVRGFGCAAVYSLRARPRPALSRRPPPGGS